MARPKRYNADYFSHDSDMRNDAKIKAVRRKFGHLGYSIWVMLLETLTDKDGFTLDWDELNIELVAGDFDIESIKLVEIVDYFKKLKMVTVEGNKIWSEKLIDRFSGLLNKRNRTRDGVMDDRNPTSEGLKTNKPVRNPQSKVKYSKVKESKVNYISNDEKEKSEKNHSSSLEINKIFKAPTLAKIYDEFFKVDKSESFHINQTNLRERADAFFEFYGDLDWCYPNTGNKIEELEPVIKKWLSNFLKSKPKNNNVAKPIPMESVKTEVVNGSESKSENIGSSKF